MEPIKQEIINNIFENGDKLITGPILQTVLIDMIDDVNVKDQEILSKTGSWDEAATQIPNLATKEEVTNLSESVARDLENVDLTGYATEQWVQSQGYLKEHQDLSDYATKVYVNEAKSTLESNLNNLSSSVSNDIQNKGEEVKTWVQDQGYLKEHQDISGLATKTELTEAENNLQGNITSLSESVARDLANVSVPEGVATEAWVQSQDYASKSYVDNAVSSSSVDLTGYATETWVESQGYLKEHQDISNLATKSELNSVSESVQTDISNLATKSELTEAKNIIQDDMITLSGSMAKTIDDYTAGLITEIQNQDYASKTYVNEAVSGINLSDYATKGELNSVSESIQTDISNLATKTELNDTKDNLQGNITNLSESVANSAVWKKDTGTDSIVQKLTGVNETNTSTASGVGAIATGKKTNALGKYSHAEGWSTTASGDYSHAEGTYTRASGFASHAEGDGTVASGSHSHAEGSNTKAEGSNSHAEGDNTKAEGESSHAEGYKASATGRYGHAEGDTSNASGLCSHAEGQSTLSSGQASHAEGFFTVASNDYEHAQGQYNHNSTNQIFSVGAGEKIGETVTRRNAVSILEVPNSDTQVVTASFFVQNVGGYDGTNPTPGTNDLATVISEVSSIWKKGTGSDSIVQKLSGDNEANTPTATGYAAVATGFKTTASGQWSHAEGKDTNASGDHSHAEGNQTIATGWNSHAEGDNTTASAHCSHAEGNHTTASAGTSHAEGSDTLTLGWCGHAEGQFTTASVHCSHAEGHKAEASGSWSHAEGNGTRTLEQCSHAEGNTTVTLGSYSHAEGNYTTASGACSHAEGDNTKALGANSHAEGSLTIASGDGSHAEGAGTTASGSYSHAEGGYTVASNVCEHAQGRYNHNSENQIFSIGTGNSVTDRRNAVSVLEVNNSGSYTSSFFVQNIGGYDGTNPTPGTNDLATVINSLSSSGGSSETLWKKGEGENSVVQVSSPREEECPTAIGPGAVAIGAQTEASNWYSHAEGAYTTASGEFSHAEGAGTIASGQFSHAEGQYTTASSDGSHAEGDHTEASGYFSHAEGTGTIASNDSEHAQGMFNHSSENQIFSVGAGDGNPSDPLTATRRNALSVLAVLNSETQITTASVFIQNVGGYNGTNPIPGTNDLATVINGMAIEGGIGTSSETWTFTLDDGSTVTKNIVMR